MDAAGEQWDCKKTRTSPPIRSDGDTMAQVQSAMTMMRRAEGVQYGRVHAKENRKSKRCFSVRQRLKKSTAVSYQYVSKIIQCVERQKIVDGVHGALVFHLRSPKKTIQDVNKSFPNTLSFGGFRTGVLELLNLFDIIAIDCWFGRLISLNLT